MHRSRKKRRHFEKAAYLQSIAERSFGPRLAIVVVLN